MSNLSPIQYRFSVLFSQIKAFLFKKTEIIPEAYNCYRDKLPKIVKVDWERFEDGFIVGKVSADDFNFVTQGKNAKEFVRMVNDAIYTAYEIPPKYFYALGGFTTFSPPEEELLKLKNKKIKKASFGNKISLMPKKELVIAK